jgi:hypothetical protein
VTANPIPSNAIVFELANDAIMIADTRGIKRWVGGANTLELETWVTWILSKVLVGGARLPLSVHRQSFQ